MENEEKEIEEIETEIEQIQNEQKSNIFKKIGFLIKSWFKKQLQILIDEFKYDPPKKIIKNILTIILGASVVALADAFFLLPMNIISGGVASMALLTSKIPNNPIDLNVWVYIYTWGFAILGFFLLGMKHTVHSIFYTITYPLMISLFTFIIENFKINGIAVLNLHQLVGDFPTITDLSSLTAGCAITYLLASVLGGLIIGSGIGLTLIGGGSSGGTDVINLSMNEWFGIKVGTSSFVVDAILIVAGFFVNDNNIITSLIGIITALLCSIMIDKVFISGRQFYVGLIHSSKCQDINAFINTELGRGTTLIKAKGGFSNVDTNILEVCFDRKDYNIIKDAINHIDPNAFVSFIETKEVLGYGFSRQQPKVNQDANISAADTRKLISKARSKKKSTFKE